MWCGSSAPSPTTARSEKHWTPAHTAGQMVKMPTSTTAGVRNAMPSRRSRHDVIGSMPSPVRAPGYGIRLPGRAGADGAKGDPTRTTRLTGWPARSASDLLNLVLTEQIGRLFCERISGVGSRRDLLRDDRLRDVVDDLHDFVDAGRRIEGASLRQLTL